MPPHVPPNQRPPYWTPAEKVKEDKPPPWKEPLRTIGIIAAVIIAAWIIFGVLGIMFQDFGNWLMNPIAHFKHLYRRARFIPPNPEFFQLILWAGFITWAIKRFINMFRK